MSKKSGGLTQEQKKLLQELTSSLTKDQLTWLGGYFTALGETKKADETAKPAEWKLLYASISGNAEWVSEEAVRVFQEHGVALETMDLRNYDPKVIINETKVLFVISTHGEGDPPYAAERFYKYIHENKPDLKKLQFSLLALGDSSYLEFCKAGRDIDKRLEELGASRIYKRTDCDQEFEKPAIEWLKGILEIIGK